MPQQPRPAVLEGSASSWSRAAALVLALEFSPPQCQPAYCRASSGKAHLCLGRSSVFGEKVETVMMQKLNDKGQSMAAPPREVSRSAKSTWTGTRAAGLCQRQGREGGDVQEKGLSHTAALGRHRQVNRKGALGKAAPLLGIYLLFPASFSWSLNLSKPWATACAVTVPTVHPREALLAASPVSLLTAPLCSHQSLHPSNTRDRESLYITRGERE